MYTLLILLFLSPPLAAFEALGNNLTTSMASATKILREVYKHEPQFTTMYCKCQFTKDKVSEECNYTPKSSRVVWRHIVPVAALAPQFNGWYNKADFKECSNLSRLQCVRRLNVEFRFMEADMYNIYPVLEDVHSLRSDYAFIDLPRYIPATLPECGFKLHKKRVEPRRESRGDIARVYFYMQDAYPTLKIIEDEDVETFMYWDFLDGISQEEVARSEAIMAIQKNCNPSVLSTCII